MFRVKICGITSRGDALAAVSAGADAIGLNFYAGSPRVVQTAQAKEIVASIPTSVHKVGVFVNHTSAEIRRLRDELELDIIQLHGEESLEVVTELRDLPLLRAVRLEPGKLDRVTRMLADYRAAGIKLSGLLVDAHAPGTRGGSGQTAPWEELVDWKKWAEGLPLILAGGLRSNNVAGAIRVVRPSGVDTASGVETAPGVKDSVQMSSFVAQALESLAADCR